MDKLNVLVVVDQFGWAFAFCARGIRRYSKHNITIKRWNGVTVYDRDQDVVFVMHTAGGWNQIQRDVRNALLKKVPQFCLGVRSEGQSGFIEQACRQYGHKSDSLHIACVSKKVLNEIKPRCGGRKVYLCQNGVDTQIFRPLLDRKTVSSLVGRGMRYPVIVLKNGFIC